MSAAIWNRAKAQKALIDRGVSYEPPRFPGWKFSIRQLGVINPHYARALVRIAAEPEFSALYARMDSEGYKLTAEDQALNDAAERAAFAEGCIVDWLVTDSKGEPLPHSLAAARMLIAEVPDLFEDLRAFARNPANYPVPKIDTISEVIRGNSAPALSM